jgi:hypothetical protein
VFDKELIEFKLGKFKKFEKSFNKVQKILYTFTKLILKLLYIKLVIVEVVLGSSNVEYEYISPGDNEKLFDLDKLVKSKLYNKA